MEQVFQGQPIPHKKTNSMNSLLEKNKTIVARFNKEVIEQGNLNAFNELVSSHVVNHAAPAGAPNGPESMSYFLLSVLRTGFPDIKVELHDQVAEGDKVSSRKTLHGTHTGGFMGIAPTHKQVSIQVLDIIRLENGQYAEHWGISNIPEVLQQLAAK